MNSREFSLSGPVAVYALTGQGLRLALCLSGQLDARIYAAASLESDQPPLFPGADPIWFRNLREQVRASFSSHSCHIFIGATGIAVRTIAPLLQGKDADPAVLVVDQRGRHVISLLSGHLGGANALTRHVADLLGATAVITTATDVEGLPALDELAREKGLAVGNLEAVKNISASLLSGKTIFLHDPGDWLGLEDSEWAALFSRGGERSAFAVDAPRAAARLEVRVTVLAPPADPAERQRRLYLHPPLICAGVGCRKNTPAGAILEAISGACAEQNIAPAAISCLASIDAKRHEAGLAEAADALKLPLLFFTAGELAMFPVSSPSPKAREIFGVEGVCESAALAAAARGGGYSLLLGGKRIINGVTVALAAPWTAWS